MFTFLVGIGILFFGYFIYGAFIERQFEPERARTTPAVKSNAKYEDRQALPHWKCMLTHFLHIAGLGPVVGVIFGAKFGPVVFLIIPIGNILGGAVHDYFSGMISMRNGANSYLEISKKFLSKPFAFFSTIFMILALLALATSFTNAGVEILSADNIFNISNPNVVLILWICVIFSYYVLSTFFPIAFFVSKISNIFGIILIVSTVSLLFFVLGYLHILPEFDFRNFIGNFTQHPQGQPILPMLFVTIACGMISGFHGLQNPITAGIETNEMNGRRTFYGMMVLEGFFAMIWAAVGIIGYINYPELVQKLNGAVILSEIVNNIVSFEILAKIILLSVVILAITTADAALRSLRILISETFHFQQKSSEDRFLLCLPILGTCMIMIFWSNITDGFLVMWNYFSLTNQIIAVIGLAISVCYMRSKNKPYIYLLVPLAFFSYIVSLYLFWISPQHIISGPVGFGLGYSTSCVLSIISSILICSYCIKHGKHLHKLTEKKEFNPDDN